MPDADLFCGVLGPLTVAHGGKPVAIGGPKERLVLALLLARANATVSVDALVEGVWDGSPPRSAERTVQAYVARLRRTLEPDRSAGEANKVLVTAGAGYRLQLTTGQSDALRFEQLAREGADQLHRGDEGAARSLRQALALWRGEAYGEFVEAEACAAEARRLGELRVVALEDRFDAEVAAGGASELVPQLEAVVAEHPFRERFWCQLMLALYRAGRQRDALATYQRARSVLTEELGIEPGPDLRELEAAILEQDPKLDRVRAEPGGPHGVLPLPLDAVGPAFVGRDVELAWLRSAWAVAVDGRGGFVSVLGPEGIGKTRLVAALAQEVQRAGAVVLYARCDHAHRGARALLDQTLRSGGSSLSELDAGERPLDDLAEAVARFLPSWARDQPVLLALDDLHLADADTLEVVADLAGWSGFGPMLIVAAFRTDAQNAPGSTPGRGAATAQVSLEGLDREALGQLCAVYGGEGWTSDDLTRLQELTGGVPLQVHEQASEWARRRAARRVEEAADRSTVARVRLAASRGEIADSVEGIQHLLEQRRANLAARETELGAGGPATALERCPYKGLAAFEADDADNFFGRERLVAELVARLAGASLLSVIGPSGSGKSSLVRAGLVPALAAGFVPVTDGWCSVIVTPGAHPTRTLSRRLAGGGDITGRRVVFIDQFEEIFTLGADRAEQVEFVDQVVALATRADTVVVLSVRGDHVGRCAALPELANLMTGNDVLVGPMRDTELRRAIELPARRAGLTIESGLVDVIVADVAGRPGALPLLSTALAETWERRTDRTLTLAGYHAAGGVNGALARMAEDAYLSLGEEARAAVRRLLLRLCDAGDDGALDLRRRLPLGDVAAGDDDAQVAVEALVARRLLTVDGDSVEVAHEALLREWPRLRMWLDEDVHGRRLQRRFSEAARAWRAGGEDPSELYRGTRLDAAIDWAAIHGPDLNDTEQAFLEASRKEAAREVDDARRRSADKTRAVRRLRALLGGTAVLLVVALVSGLLFLRQRNRAEGATRTATAQNLAGKSNLALDEDPELGILLALEAVEATRSAGENPLPEAISALQQAVQASRVEWRGDDGAATVAVSPDGRLLVTDSLTPGDVIVWDAATGEKRATLSGPGDAVSDVDVSPDGQLVAASYTASDGDEPSPAVVLWDLGAGTEVSRLMGPPAYYFPVTFSGDGRLVAARSVDQEGAGAVSVWDVATGAQQVSFNSAGDAVGVEFVDGGRTLLVPDPDAERVGFYSVADGREVDAIETPGFEPTFVSTDPAGGRVALLGSAAVQVWDLETREPLETIPIAAGWIIDWSPDGERLAISGNNQSVIRIVDPATGDDVMALHGHEGPSVDVAFLPDGEHLASVQWTGGLRVWDVTPDGSPELGGLTLTSAAGQPARLTVSPDGSEIMATTGQSTIELVATDSGQSRVIDHQLVDFPSFWPRHSASWNRVGSVDERTGRGAVRSLDTLATVAELPPCTSPVGFSPDGSRVLLDGRGPCTATDGLPATFAAPTGTDLHSRVIDVRTGETVLDLGERFVLGGEFNPAGPFAEGRYLAVHIDSTIEFYDVVTGELLATYGAPDDDFIHLVFDPQGRWLAVSSVRRVVRVFDLEAIVSGASADQALIMNAVAHNGGLRAPTLTADGVLATTGSGDGLIRLWDIASGQMTLELRIDTTGLFPIAFGHDGSYLYYAEGDVIRKYPLDNEALIGLARGRLTRGFTAEECVRYLGPDRCA